MIENDQNWKPSVPFQSLPIETADNSQEPYHSDVDGNIDGEIATDMNVNEVSIVETEVIAEEETQTANQEPQVAQTSKKFCHVCNTEYKNLDKHLKTMHAAVTRPFECFICHRMFKTRCTLAQHMVFHSAPSRVCQICGKAFFNGTDLKTHILSVHSTGKS